jgi:hypothetical protein
VLNHSDKPEAEAHHIQKWSNLITAGWKEFTSEIVKECSHAKPKPIAFAMLTQGDMSIQIAHGFAQMAMEEDSHPCHRLLGFFLGDRIVTTFQNEAVLQDPLFVTIPEAIRTSAVLVKTAVEGTIKKMAPGGLSKGNAKAPEVTVPVFLPLPLSWVPYFLEKRRSNWEAYFHMHKKLAKWTAGSVELRDTNNEVLTWFRGMMDVETHPSHGMMSPSSGLWRTYSYWSRDRRCVHQHPPSPRHHQNSPCRWRQLIARPPPCMNESWHCRIVS